MVLGISSPSRILGTNCTVANQSKQRLGNSVTGYTACQCQIALNYWFGKTSLLHNSCLDVRTKLECPITDKQYSRNESVTTSGIVIGESYYMLSRDSPSLWSRWHGWPSSTRWPPPARESNQIHLHQTTHSLIAIQAEHEEEGTNLEVAVHEVPLIAWVAGVCPHVLHERGELPQNLFVLPLHRATYIPIPNPPHASAISTVPNPIGTCS